MLPCVCVCVCVVCVCVCCACVCCVCVFVCVCVCVCVVVDGLPSLETNYKRGDIPVLTGLRAPISPITRGFLFFLIFCTGFFVPAWETPFFFFAHTAMHHVIAFASAVAHSPPPPHTHLPSTPLTHTCPLPTLVLISHVLAQVFTHSHTHHAFSLPLSLPPSLPPSLALSLLTHTTSLSRSRALSKQRCVAGGKIRHRGGGTVTLVLIQGGLQGEVPLGGVKRCRRFRPQVLF